MFMSCVCCDSVDIQEYTAVRTGLWGRGEGSGDSE